VQPTETPIANLKKQLLTFLSLKPRGRFTLKQLTHHLKIKSADDYQDLRSLLDDLEKHGNILRDDDGKIGYAVARPKKEHEAPRRMIGKLSMNKRGFGFVQLEGMEREIFISPKSLATAFHGDIVEVAPFAQTLRSRRKTEEDREEGEIVRIVERVTTTIVGTLEQSARFSFVIPDDERFTRDIYVAREDLKGALHGDKVVVKLLAWKDEQQNPEGEIVEVLGRSGDARIEVLSVARSFGLPMTFPKEVEAEAHHISDIIPDAEIKRRLDLRKTLCVTIDPADARDFDDAVSFEDLPDGRMNLGVHIADVSHYVEEGSALDREALARGTSVYMVNEVIPMLPERLSNDLCSLKPDVDRLAYSVLMTLNSRGTVEDYAIRKSIIRSRRRFAYEDVQAILTAGKGEHAEMLLPLFRLTQTLLKKRHQNGSIDFETGEAKFEFDTTGMPSKIIRKERLDAHRLIEECMLLANKVVAQHIGKVKSEDHARPFIYRVHDIPDPSRLADLARFVKMFGYSLDTKQAVSAKALQRLLEQVKGSEVENFINQIALRSMAKAIYSEKNVGHFGLAFPYYTHFTSPIRRYPDLKVHRLLLEYEQGLSFDRRQEIAKRLPTICRISSEREKLAADAERQSIKVMQIEYMKRHVGDEFEGVIGGVTQYGLFIEISELLVEGLAHVRDFTDDYYMFDEKQYTLRGRSSGRAFRLGDKVTVKVVSVNAERREMDFAIVAQAGKSRRNN
jgi:ribonuclease R